MNLLINLLVCDQFRSYYFMMKDIYLLLYIEKLKHGGVKYK